MDNRGTPGTYPASGSLARADRTSYSSTTSSTSGMTIRASGLRSNSPSNSGQRGGTSPRSSPRLSGGPSPRLSGGPSPRLSGGFSGSPGAPKMLLDLVCIVVGKPALSPPFTVSVFPDVSVATFRELVAARLEASLKSRGLRHVDLDLFRADHGPLTSDNPKLSSLAVSSHAFTPTEIRSVLPVTLITINPSALMSDFFAVGQTFSSLSMSEGLGVATDIIVTVRRNAYNEARLNLSLQQRQQQQQRGIGASPPLNPMVDRPLNPSIHRIPNLNSRPSSPLAISSIPTSPTNSSISTNGSPISPLGPAGRGLIRPQSHSSLLARGARPMSEILEVDEEDAKSIRKGGARRSSSLSSIAASVEETAKEDAKDNLGALGAASTGSLQRIGSRGSRRAPEGSIPLRRRSSSVESHRSCPETFGRKSRDWENGIAMDDDVDKHPPFVPTEEPAVVKKHHPFHNLFGRNRTASSGSNNQMLPSPAVAVDVDDVLALGSASGKDGVLTYHAVGSDRSAPLSPDAFSEDGSRGIVFGAGSSSDAASQSSGSRTAAATPLPAHILAGITGVPVHEVEETGAKRSNLNRGFLVSKDGEDVKETGDVEAIAAKRLAGGLKDGDDPLDARRKRRRRICCWVLWVSIVLSVLVAAAAIYIVWPVAPQVKFVNGSKRSTMVNSAGVTVPVEPIAGTSGQANGPTFIAQFKNDLEFEVSPGSGFGGGFYPLTVRSVGVGGFVLTTGTGGNGNGPVDAGAVPAGLSLIEFRNSSLSGSADGNGLVLPSAKRGGGAVSVVVPTLVTYSTYQKVNVTGDQVVTYQQVLSVVCGLLVPQGKSITFNYEVRFAVPAFSWIGFNPKATGTGQIPC
ncbi:hypothetical protein HDU97_001483 [Phlyctochytrium planicorne]|nr:hypothetical protein HDU97_001483 [Phlyctochytrium planicorne]